MIVGLQSLTLKCIARVFFFFFLKFKFKFFLKSHYNFVDNVGLYSVCKEMRKDTL